MHFPAEASSVHPQFILSTSAESIRLYPGFAIFTSNSSGIIGKEMAGQLREKSLPLTNQYHHKGNKCWGEHYTFERWTDWRWFRWGPDATEWWIIVILFCDVWSFQQKQCNWLIRKWAYGYTEKMTWWTEAMILLINSTTRVILREGQ